MAIPVEFNVVENLQKIVRRYVNKEVRRDFQDLDNADGSWEPDVSTTRGNMRYAQTHQDNDSLDITLLRLFIYYFIYGKARALQGAIYGFPVVNYQEEVAFHPQVELFFAQDSQAVPEDKSVIQATINFRLMDETTKTMTEAKAKALAIAIKNELVTAGQGVTFNKGRYIVTYVDKALGYHLQIYASSKIEGEEVIKKVLSIQNHTYDPEKSNLSTPNKNSVNNPTGTDLVYGKQRKKPRWRPTAKVRFRYATLKLSGILRDIILVDTTGHFRDALQKNY